MLFFFSFLICCKKNTAELRHLWCDGTNDLVSFSECVFASKCEWIEVNAHLWVEVCNQCTSLFSVYMYQYLVSTSPVWIYFSDWERWKMKPVVVFSEMITFNDGRSWALQMRCRKGRTFLANLISSHLALLAEKRFLFCPSHVSYVGCWFTGVPEQHWFVPGPFSPAGRNTDASLIKTIISLNERKINRDLTTSSMLYF